MRKEFCDWVAQEALSNTKLIFLTGDLGFRALERVAEIMGPRFINMGVAEQNMISVAAGMAHDGWQVLCYSIAPFAVFRPAEQIRLDVCLHNKNVKIIGNGGGYGYGIMGATHHALEDLGYMSSLPNMRCYIPQSEEDVEGACTAMMSKAGPSYLRLNIGSEKNLIQKSQKFSATRKIFENSPTPKNVIVGLGPMALVGVQAGIKDSQVYSVTELPILKLEPEFLNVLSQAKNILVLEEHVARGGLGEHLAWHLMQKGISGPKLIHQYAQGYPNGLYGSQHYHQKISGLTLENVQSLFQGE